MPTDVLRGLSPYKKLMKRKPRLDHVRVFGCLCYTSIKKFETRSIPSVMLRYSLTQKGHKLLNLENNNIFVNRDVKFAENIFPFKNNSSEIKNLFIDGIANGYNDIDFLQMIKAANIDGSYKNNTESDEVDQGLPDNPYFVETYNNLNDEAIIHPKRSGRIVKASVRQMHCILYDNCSVKYPIENCFFLSRFIFIF